MSQPERIAQILKHEFQNTDLLEEALTHKSHAVEMGGVDNERLEFLGDAVLELLITEGLMRHFAAASEGQLSRIRASMVRTESLADVARQWKLGEALRFGKGEAGTGGADKDTVLAGAFEAILGALYVDAGLLPCREVIVAVFGKRILAIEDPVNFGRDPKSALQEEAMARVKCLPVYQEVDVTGPPHQRTYTISVEVPGVAKATGQGTSKRNAQRAAAEAALELLIERVPS